jgi:hypothetical protein
MSIVLQSTGGGSVSIVEPTTASNFTQTLPASTGTVMVSGNMPAFSAYQTGNQTIANNTATKVTLNTEIFDTANCFDSTTNYRFTPNVAGYYLITASVTYGSASANGTCQAKISKNGAVDTNTALFQVLNGNLAGSSVSAIIYLNGSTDYIELYTSQSTGSNLLTFANSAFVFMTGSLVRTA